MKPAHPLIRRRATATAALFLLQSVLLLPLAAPTTTVALTAQSVHREVERMLVPPHACQEFYQQEAAEAAAAVVATVSASNNDNKKRNNDTASMAMMPPTTSFWTSSDCVDVWTSWTGTLPVSLQPSYPDRRRLRERALDMRQRGSPCLVKSIVKADGVGSMTMRHLTTKIFAEEVGCDWLTPEWGTPTVDDGSGASWYCHSVATYEEQRRGFNNNNNATQEEGVIPPMIRRCSLTNWLEFFNFKMSSIELPANCSFRVVEADTSSVEDLESVLGEIDIRGFDNLEWDRLKIVLRRPHASSDYLASLGSWDDWKREAVRKVLREFRENFHQFPRPWYNDSPECGYESSELNFALHLRMGDRRDIEGVTPEYFSLLEAFMEVVTQEVVEKGHAAPMFHVFSEALYPCPSPENGTFNEFPLWPVERDQIPACMVARVPADCPEKRARASNTCRPARSGTFRVEGRPLLLLHVGQDVASTLSCMVHADGLLMGCSTFGQLAGVLNRDGTSFFSTNCGGLGSAMQGKMIPPLAVAEGGRMWVPVVGSWRDPVLRAKHVFSAALDELLKSKGLSE